MRQRRTHGRLPTADELVIAPELAILVALEAAIDLAIVALVAARPELQPTHDGRCPATTPAAECADNVIGKAQALAAAIGGYRFERVREHDVLPF